METQDKKELFKISIHVVGIKKRCRKPDRHIFSLGYVPYNDGAFNQDEIEKRAKDFLAENMKQVLGVPNVSLNRVVKSEGVETWEMFSDKNKSFKILSGLENVLA